MRIGGGGGESQGEVSGILLSLSVRVFVSIGVFVGIPQTSKFFRLCVFDFCLDIFGHASFDVFFLLLIIYSFWIDMSSRSTCISSLFWVYVLSFFLYHSIYVSFSQKK